jgi:CarboxypepD_reg-like domain
MKIFQKYILILFTIISINAKAQVTLQGTVYANGKEKKPLSFTTIINSRTKQMVSTSTEGKYTISVNKGDTLKVSFIGYNNVEFEVPYSIGLFDKNFYLLPSKNILTTIKITGLTKYQKDSIERANLYDETLNTEQVSTISSPVTSVYQQFSKKYKDLRKFQNQYHNYEQQKFIDTKYTYDVVAAVTKLTGDDVAYFMNTFPMEYKFARLAGDLEIKMWIKSNFKNYVPLKK